jgi:hypothetical protein
MQTTKPISQSVAHIYTYSVLRPSQSSSSVEPNTQHRAYANNKYLYDLSE